MQAAIDDAATSTTALLSAEGVDNRIQGVVAAAPAALDTLNEIASALGNDANFAGTITTQLGAKANVADVYTQTELGDPETDLVALFNAALA